MSGEANGNVAEVGVLVAIAYPERIARRRNGKEARYQTTGGTGAVLPAWSPLAREEFLAVADVDGIGTEARVFLAATLRRSDILDVFAHRITHNEEVFWDAAAQAVVARRTEMLDRLVIAEQDNFPSVKNTAAVMIEGIRGMGLAALPWDSTAEFFRARSEWLRQNGLVDQSWPDLSDAHLLQTLEVWLQPFLDGVTRRSHLARLNMLEILRSLFSFAAQKELDRLAPARFRVPTGSEIVLDYSSGEQPVLAVKLQEMFGQTTTPTIAAGKVPLLIHLLSPAGRPLAVTQDLRSFWTNVYPEVRKRMRGRYPKHPWPEDPLNAVPTRKTKQSQSR